MIYAPCHYRAFYCLVGDVRQTSNYTIIHNSFSKPYKEKLGDTIELIAEDGGGIKDIME